MPSTSCFHSILAASALILVAGCGGGGSDAPPIGRVEGVVKMDGQPLPGVIVGFEPQGVSVGGPSNGRTDDQGHYELTYSNGTKGAIIGTHKVTITTPTEGPPPPGQKYKDPIPARYNSASELSQEVQAGANVIDLELSSQ